MVAGVAETVVVGAMVRRTLGGAPTATPVLHLRLCLRPYASTSPPPPLPPLLRLRLRLLPGPHRDGVTPSCQLRLMTPPSPGGSGSLLCF
ncbi:hypothetical protein E2542_SST27649 [Spatholobus suberectus]|nr:hypothetical protein E2542_SST27649 [Spatholobus suberectus]